MVEASNTGWTPFHYAAYAVREAIVKELLLACTKNEEGMAGLHVAAREGQVPVLEKIAETCPDIWDLKDNNGRTALHVAAESGKANAVKFILKQVTEDHINDQDNEGNTAMHLATLQGWMKIQLSIAGLASLEQGRKKKIAARTEPAKDNAENHEDEEVEDKRVKPGAQEVLPFAGLRNVANTDILVSTLKATAAFAVPGGYRNHGPDEGMPVLIKRASFKAFVVGNTTALVCSFLTPGVHRFNTFVVNRKSNVKWTGYALLLSFIASFGMGVAFIAGSCAVLADCAALFMAVLLSSYFLHVLLFSLALFNT
ncbi:hypothetical protein P3X46_008359 [Hevea brasiliensis]|uniref:PGG domain-containing protein n=1 Tax=Hevea brasiliensis TaxID=3981 RepID=A0ABQ9MME4_HEVBR|nr:hypothetical protein P3X46_008359 [Hevea brasiliensis]